MPINSSSNCQPGVCRTTSYVFRESGRRTARVVVIRDPVPCTLCSAVIKSPPVYGIFFFSPAISFEWAYLRDKSNWTWNGFFWKKKKIVFCDKRNRPLRIKLTCARACSVWPAIISIKYANQTRTFDIFESSSFTLDARLYFRQFIVDIFSPNRVR